MVDAITVPDIAPRLENQHLPPTPAADQVFASLRNWLAYRHHSLWLHAVRVAISARKTAAILGLSATQCRTVGQAAILHDIGKLLIPRNCFDRSGPLDGLGWQNIQRHPVLGADVLCRYEALGHLVPAVLFHHERWDGRGYPQGLKGDAIPLEARIIAVCDSFDAMTNDRVYRNALSQRAAYAEINAHAGTQFDPNVVSAFLSHTLRTERRPTPNLRHVSHML